jgi:hypothetical protein
MIRRSSGPPARLAKDRFQQERDRWKGRAAMVLVCHGVSLEPSH